MSYVRSDFKIFYNEEEIKILHFLLNDTILVQVLELILQYICDIVTRKKKDSCCSSQDLHYAGSFLSYAYRTVVNFKRSKFVWE